MFGLRLLTCTHQIDNSISYEALLDTGAVKSAVVSNMSCVRFHLKSQFILITQIVAKVRLVSEEFSALLDSRFPKEIADYDLKFVRDLLSQSLPLSHPMSLALALHTARISSRISQNDSLLLQYMSDKSPMRISSMMAVLLQAAGDVAHFCYVVH